MLGIIGGSGFQEGALLENPQPVTVETPYGPVEVEVGTIAGKRAAFVLRHGPGHSLPPHRVNYRGNIWAMRACGVDRVVAVMTVGGLSDRMSPGVLMVPDQIVDRTWGRESTFHDGGPSGVVHIDFTEPFSRPARSALLASAARLGVPVLDGGVYVCTQGPRLETAAEVQEMRRAGYDAVGMTAMPEAALAREAGLEYAALIVSVNWGAGLAASRGGVDLEEAARVTQGAFSSVGGIIRGTE